MHIIKIHQQATLPQNVRLGWEGYGEMTKGGYMPGQFCLSPTRSPSNQCALIKTLWRNKVYKNQILFKAQRKPPHLARQHLWPPGGRVAISLASDTPGWAARIRHTFLGGPSIPLLGGNLRNPKAGA